MKKYYRIVNGKQESGIGEFVPDGFIVYENEPQELINALALEKQKQEEQDLKLEQSKTRDEAMLTGATYKLNNEDYQISFTKEDGDGLVQIKSALELGLTQTNIHFSNGIKMPISSSDFPAFALWFVNKRNEFFL